MLENYLDHDARILFGRFSGEEDVAWAESVVATLKKRYPKADHWTIGGASLQFIDVAIGKKGLQASRGWPVFYIRQEAGNGPPYLAVNKHTDISRTEKRLRRDEAPTDMAIDAWIESLELTPDGRNRLDGEGHNPVDYPASERRDEDAEADTGGSQATVASSAAEQSLNRILYGPPGTGKTYRTIEEALSIIDGPASGVDFAEQKQRFDALRMEGRIAFVTFHQSFSYEDFIEGIRADAVAGQLNYKVQDGIFKRMAIRAMYRPDVRAGEKAEPGFDDIHDAFLDAIGKSLPYQVTSAQGGQLAIVDVNNRGNLSVTHPNRVQRHIVSRRRLKQLYEAYPDQESLARKNVSEAITDVIGGANVTTYWSVLNRLLAFKKEVKGELDTDHGEVLLDEEALEYDQIKRRVLDNAVLSPNDKPYVLIIDEINRGNMSRIFGELITLIEPSKRAGRPETAEVQLPYSQERFSVPDNLYVIGTMNTADRSLAVVDTALRRRFDFIEMMPDTTQLAYRHVAGIDLVNLLDTINLRIEHLYDREHMIGHSFFMGLARDAGVSDLARIFLNKVLPLLEEYFYEDWDKISKILGRSGIYEPRQAANLGFTHAAVSWRRCAEKLEFAETYLRIYAASDTPQEAQASHDA